MKAVVVTTTGAPAGIAYADHPDPVPGPGEVLIAVEAIETNYPDLLVVEGRYQVRPPVPFVPGKGAAGRVAGLGPGVSGLALGQRVATQVEYGAYAERLCAPAALCYPVPDAIPLVEATAAVLAYQTAWFALTDRAALAPGETVLVLGAAGGVGIAAIQLARALGAGLVVAGTRGSAKHDAIRRAGADAITDLAAPDLREALRADVHRLTGGRGADIVVDPVGGAAFEPALRSLAWRGRHVVIGFAGGEIPVARTNYLLVKNIAVLGLQTSDYRDRCPEETAAAQAAIFRFMAEGRFRPVVSEVLPLHAFATALDRLRAGRAEGKIILTTEGHRP
ncbi:NADPH:quinone oxidoreductase family protein [uncultured Methylobacterium sp.]|jgi:NADPH2:quinone reductase|uniref:NADPH:quinone oxidoreductase family protein n=1 Tax=uncultured Methylobacterium sp. TaxID=157278 RepID=UPI00261E8366|nr:NADPH:quinone oxidoreductase family protein [uncultured Methylobacterium sp.]